MSHVEDPEMRTSLERVVARMTSNPTLQQDLLQEALIHLWFIEHRRPDQTQSWYVQSCYFRLQHYLAVGRSIDSPKRSSGRIEPSDADDQQELEIPVAYDLLSDVSTRELLWMLPQHLSEDEKAVLDCLVAGLGCREIGRRLRMSHTMALRHRCRIAEVVRKLDSPRSVPRLNPPTFFKTRYLPR